MLDMIIAAIIMIVTAGVIQTNNVKYAKLGPPILNAIAVNVCVEAGPGRI
jgi:hypothetical protein